MPQTKHVTRGNTARRNGETRTHGPLVPNQVRYLLRYIPLEGMLFGRQKHTHTKKSRPYGATTYVIPDHGGWSILLAKEAGDKA